MCCAADVLRNARGSLVLVVDEYGMIQGLLTPLDVLEAIAGEFPDADEVPDIIEKNGTWLARGTTNLHQLEQELNHELELTEDEDLATLSGFCWISLSRYLLRASICISAITALR